MTFVRQTSVAALLVALTLWLQSAGVGVLIIYARTSLASDMHRFGPLRSAALMVRFTTANIASHLVQILLWAGMYRWLCFSQWESVFYFSTSSYSTVGYGDVVLPHTWRMLGPVGSVVGVLMCGFSVSFLFVMINRLVEHDTRLSRELAMPVAEHGIHPGNQSHNHS
jgi:voltage-gated potassium channel